MAEIEVGDLIDVVYENMEGAEDLMRYHDEHGTPSMQILTQFSPKTAIGAVKLLTPLIKNKKVIELGGGVGFLAIEMAKIAKSVIAIEADPAWSWVFTRSLYKHKPKNLTWIFGSAETVSDYIKGDIVIVATNSGIPEMREMAKKLAPESFFLYQDNIR
jgi:protein-L-isoaspartate O-methyltransferase